MHKVEDLGWNGDMLEAEAFAFLAIGHIVLAYPLLFRVQLVWQNH